MGAVSIDSIIAALEHLPVAVIDEARKRNYARLVLDTLPKLTSAIALYGDLGFHACGPYLPAPTPGALCFELRLS